VHIVGPKGQIVISKELRDQLGVEPGWLTVQRLVDGHVEIHFVPPEHNESLKGVLARYNNRTVPPEEWNHTKQAAWGSAARRKMSPRTIE
jgi:hypothetical protein